MRIRINNLPLLGKSEGVRRYIRELSHELAHGSYGQPLELSCPDVSRRLLSVPKAGFFLRNGIELAGLWPAGRADVLHYTDTFGPLISRCPVVLTVHDTTFLTHPHLHDPRVVRWLSTLTYLTWPKVEEFIAVSEATKRDMVSAGVDPGRITVVRHGVDHISRISGALELPLGVEAGNYFFFLGNLEPRKNLRSLLRAFANAAPAMHSSTKLVIAGKFAWGDQPTAEIDALIRAGKLLHLGFVDNALAKRLMMDCIAFVYPSAYEGFGLPPLEALGVGASVIAGDNPAAREVLGDNAAFVDPDDEASFAEALIAAPVKSFDENNRRKWVDSFTWQKAAKETVEVYARAANKGS